jgi:hypothetical protein
MKILLTTLNSKFVHTSLALRYLYFSINEDYDTVLKEFTINEELFKISRVRAYEHGVYEICSTLGYAREEVLRYIKNRKVSISLHDGAEADRECKYFGEEVSYIYLDKYEIIKNGNSVEISIMPRKLSYPTVVGELINNHIGYIRIMSFGSITSEEFNKKLYELKNSNADSFIIDLRNNPGGYLYSAINIAGHFIGQSTAIIVEDKVNGRFSIKADKHVDIINQPVIFLMNEFSASASEILLCAVRFYNTDFFIGENTYGKGVAQSVFKFDDGSVLKTTTLKFYTPDGREINNIGIAPNIKVNNVDPLIAAELLLKDNKKNVTRAGFAMLNIDNKEYVINLEDIHSKDHWEAYRHILSTAKSLIMIDNQKSNKLVPKIQFAEMPITSYKVGNRISFKLSAPNYSKKVQYRAILWDESTNSYRDIWNTQDCYYNKWIPNGNGIFTVGFTATKPGNYRIKFFAKRSGIENKYTALKGMNCDSYIGEVPFIVSQS